jgi:hypothetical protein
MSSPTRLYYRGHDLVAMRDDQQGQNRYYHFDHQGTTQCLTDVSGAVTDRFASDAWGVPVKRTGNSINKRWYIGSRNVSSQEKNLLQGPSLLANPYRARFLFARQGALFRIPIAPYVFALNSPANVPGPTPAINPNSYLFIRPCKPGANKTGECGGVNYSVSPIIRGPGPHKGGWIIQHVFIQERRFDCDNNLIDRFDDEYWEAWEVDTNGNVCNGQCPNGLGQSEDGFDTPDRGPGTWGIQKKTGFMQYKEGFKLIVGVPGWWFVGVIPSAGPAPTTRSPQGAAGVDDAVATLHQLTVTWRCCCKDARPTDFYATPNDPPYLDCVRSF